MVWRVHPLVAVVRVIEHAIEFGGPDHPRLCGKHEPGQFTYCEIAAPTWSLGVPWQPKVLHLLQAIRAGVLKCCSHVAAAETLPQNFW